MANFFFENHSTDIHHISIMELKRVVITGMGAITPIGNDVKTYWNNLLAGVSGAARITHFDPTLFKTKFACEVKDFNGEQYFDRKEIRKIDPYLQFAIAAAIEAIQDSALDFEAEDLDRIGVVLGVGIGGVRSFEDSLLEYGRNEEKGPCFSPFLVPKMIPDMCAGMISIRYGLRGPNYTTCAACASATCALNNAFDLIRMGRADVIVSGGAESAISKAGIGGFSSMHALSTRNDDPATASRPFSASRDGFVLGEGAGILILEELEHALARGAHIYAELAGTGLSADAYHMTASHPEGLGAITVMRNALANAGMQPEEIDHINTHGTSTPVGDVSEAKAILGVFGEHAYQLSINSTKSMTGHLLGAAGAVEAIAAVLAVENDVVPPTINHEDGDEDEGIDYRLDFTFGKARHRMVRAALSNTFGFGGHNASALFKKYER